MTLAALNAWLMSDGVRADVNVLTRLTVRTELDNLAPDASGETPEIDWTRLLFAGSILARSGLRPEQETALRIATAAVTMDNTQPVKDAGAVLFDKLSNFRAVGLAHDRELLVSGLDARLGMALRMEMQRRQMDHSVLVESSGRWLPVNDFQQRFWERRQQPYLVVRVRSHGLG